MTLNSSLPTSFFDTNIYQIPENEFIIDYIKGLNKKQYLIIFNCSSEEEKDLIPYLQKILSAISVQLEEDTLYLNLPDEKKISISHLIKINPVNKILIFGIKPEVLSLNIQVPTYTVFPFLEKKWLWSDSLLEIFLEKKVTNRPKAGALWTALNELNKL